MVCINQMSSYAGHGSDSVDGERENTIHIKDDRYHHANACSENVQSMDWMALRGIPSTDLVPIFGLGNLSKPIQGLGNTDWAIPLVSNPQMGQ